MSFQRTVSKSPRAANRDAAQYMGLQIPEEKSRFGQVSRTPPDTERSWDDTNDRQRCMVGAASISEMDTSTAASVLQAMELQEAAATLAAMDVPNAKRILQALPPGVINDLFGQMTVEETRALMQELPLPLLSEIVMTRPPSLSAHDLQNLSLKTSTAVLTSPTIPPSAAASFLRAMESPRATEILLSSELSAHAGRVQPLLEACAPQWLAQVLGSCDKPLLAAQRFKEAGVKLGSEILPHCRPLEAAAIVTALDTPTATDLLSAVNPNMAAAAVLSAMTAQSAGNVLSGMEPKIAGMLVALCEEGKSIMMVEAMSKSSKEAMLVVMDVGAVTRLLTTMIPRKAAALLALLPSQAGARFLGCLAVPTLIAIIEEAAIPITLSGLLRGSGSGFSPAVAAGMLALTPKQFVGPLLSTLQASTAEVIINAFDESIKESVLDTMLPGAAAQCRQLVFEVNPPLKARVASSVSALVIGPNGEVGGMLDSQQAWQPKGSSEQWNGQWYQMDLGRVQPLAGVVLQGAEGTDERVTGFTVRVSNGTMKLGPNSWVDVDRGAVFQGAMQNAGRHSILFKNPVQGSIVRIQPVSFNRTMSMRAGVLVAGVSPGGKVPAMKVTANLVQPTLKWAREAKDFVTQAGASMIAIWMGIWSLIVEAARSALAKRRLSSKVAEGVKANSARKSVAWQQAAKPKSRLNLSSPWKKLLSSGDIKTHLARAMAIVQQVPWSPKQVAQLWRSQVKEHEVAIKYMWQMRDLIGVAVAGIVVLTLTAAIAHLITPELIDDADPVWTPVSLSASSPPPPTPSPSPEPFHQPPSGEAEMLLEPVVNPVKTTLRELKTVERDIMSKWKNEKERLHVQHKLEEGKATAFQEELQRRQNAHVAAVLAARREKNLSWWWMPITRLLEPVSAILSLVTELVRVIAVTPMACLRAVFLLPHLIATKYVYLMHEARITLIFLQVMSLLGLMMAYLSYQSYLREKQRRPPDSAAHMPPRAVPALTYVPLPQLAAPQPMLPLQHDGSSQLEQGPKAGQWMMQAGLEDDTDALQPRKSIGAADVHFVKKEDNRHRWIMPSANDSTNGATNGNPSAITANGTTNGTPYGTANVTMHGKDENWIQKGVPKLSLQSVIQTESGGEENVEFLPVQVARSPTAHMEYQLSEPLNSYRRLASLTPRTRNNAIAEKYAAYAI